MKKKKRSHYRNSSKIQLPKHRNRDNFDTPSTDIVQSFTLAQILYNRSPQHRYCTIVHLSTYIVQSFTLAQILYNRSPQHRYCIIVHPSTDIVQSFTLAQILYNRSPQHIYCTIVHFPISQVIITKHINGNDMISKNGMRIEKAVYAFLLD